MKSSLSDLGKNKYLNFHSICFILLFVFNSIIVNAQFSVADTSINTNGQEFSYTMFFLKENDTLHEDNSLRDFFIEFDSLIPGTYHVEIHSNDFLNEKIFRKQYELTSNDTSKIAINLYLDERKIGPNHPAEMNFNNFEGQFTIAFHQNPWTKESDLFLNNFSYKQDYNFYTYKGNRAFVQGGGYEYQRNTFRKDSSQFTFTNNDTITKEFYHQLTFNYHVKIRLFTGRVNSSLVTQKLFLDLGLAYYYPIFKRHVAEYENNFKYVEKHIGIPNDVRIFINFGWYPVGFFASYRPFNSYQKHAVEASKFQFGLSLSIPQN